MASKYYSKYIYTYSFSSFLKDPSNPKSKTLSTYILYYSQNRTNKNKRKVLQLLDPNILSKKPATICNKYMEFFPLYTQSEIYLEPLV
jgi:hypothetical protein